MASDAGTQSARPIETGKNLDAVVVGAGFAGMYMLHRLRSLGLTARAYEAGGGVGGCVYRILDSTILVVKATEDRQ